MNFLSSAFSSLTGTSIPYTFKEKVAENVGEVWTLHDGINPKNQEPVLIFEYQVKDNSRAEPLARNAAKKLKMIKFPQVVLMVDFIETEAAVYLITEPVTQLSTYLDTHQVDPDAKVFGIYGIVTALAFINSKCNCVHGNVYEQSVFVTAAGDWKLLGFELCTNLTLDPDQPIYRNLALLSHWRDIVPDGLDHEQLRQFPTKLDSYELGHFITQVFKGQVPKQLVNAVRKLANLSVPVRLTTDKFATETASIFDQNEIIVFNRELDELKFKNGDEKLAFCKYNLNFLDSDEDLAGKFPPGLLGHKLVPELVAQYTQLNKFKPQGTPEEIAAGQETVNILLNYIIKLGTKVDDDVFERYIKPIIFEAFLITDRLVRLMLLNSLAEYEAKLTEADIQQKIFVPLLLGFADTNFLIRETTLKSIMTIIDKVSQKQVNNELLRVLAKLQQDPKPLIRVNTLVLIIKISSKIYLNLKNSVVITALSKSLRDTFIPLKMMALLGFELLKLEFSLEEICAKVLGQLAIALMDPKSAKVRHEAKRVFTLYLDEVEHHAASLPNVEEDDDQEEADFFSLVNPTAGAANAAGAAYSFGWSMVNKFVLSLSVGGLMNQDLNTLTPDLTRVSTPTPAKPLPTKPQPVDDGWDNDDGWDEDVVEPVKKLLFGSQAPKPAAKPTPAPRRVVRPAKSSTLKLGSKTTPGSTLKLDIQQDSHNDGWGDDDDLDDW